MRTPVEIFTQAVSSGNIGNTQKGLTQICLAGMDSLELRLKTMALAVSRDNVQIISLLDKAGWLNGYCGDLHPLSIAVNKRKTNTVRYLLEKGHFTNSDLVSALASSISRAGEQIDRRRETIHKMLLDKLERKPDQTSAWHSLLAAFLGSKSGWLQAAHEHVTPHLFSHEQQIAFLDIWPGNPYVMDERTSQWLLEEGLDPDLASQKASFWHRLAQPFVARACEQRMLAVTGPAIRAVTARENMRL